MNGEQEELEGDSPTEGLEIGGVGSGLSGGAGGSGGSRDAADSVARLDKLFDRRDSGGGDRRRIEFADDPGGRDESFRQVIAGTSRRDPGTVGGSNEEDEEGGAPKGNNLYEDAAAARREFLKNAQRFLNSKGGKDELLEKIKIDLLINYQFDVMEGQGMRDGPGAAGHARMSRRQAKETAEVLLGILEELKKK